MRHSRTRRVQRAFAIAISLLVAMPDAVFAVEVTSASNSTKSMDRMSPQELEHFVQQLNESANWRKYRRSSDPPDFVPGKPVRVMHGAGSSVGRGGGMRGGGQSFRRGGLANRRNAKSGRGRNRDDAMAQSRGNSRSSRSSSSSGSRSSFGSSSRNSGSSSRNSSGSSRNNSSFGNNNSNSAFDQ